MTYRFSTAFGLMLVAACGLVLSSAPAQAISLIPDADARLANDPDRGADSGTGGSSVWEVRWHEAPRVRIGYVRYDISGIDPAFYDTATLSGHFADSGRNGPGDGSGQWTVYGLNDDVVADGDIQGNDWDEGSINYSNAAGVDNSAAEGTFAFTSDATELGTMSFDGVDEQPLPFSSNTTDLPLGDFLSADTDGLVTFMFMSSSQDGHEYQIDSKEGNMSEGHGPTTLNFVPEPSSVALVGLALAGLGLAVRRRK